MKILSDQEWWYTDIWASEFSPFSHRQKLNKKLYILGIIYTCKLSIKPELENPCPKMKLKNFHLLHHLVNLSVVEVVSYSDAIRQGWEKEREEMGKIPGCHMFVFP